MVVHTFFILCNFVSMEKVFIPRFWEDFKTLPEFKPLIRGCPNCRSKCSNCSRPWNETQTEFVHFFLDEKNKANYICDACLAIKKIEIENVSQPTQSD